MNISNFELSLPEIELALGEVMICEGTSPITAL